MANEYIYFYKDQIYIDDVARIAPNILGMLF